MWTNLKKDCILWFILNSYHVDTWYIERLKFIASLRCISRLPFCIGLIVYENVMKTSWSPNNIFPDDDNWNFKEINDFRVAIKSELWFYQQIYLTYQNNILRTKNLKILLSFLRRTIAVTSTVEIYKIRRQTQKSTTDKYF